MAPESYKSDVDKAKHLSEGRKKYEIRGPYFTPHISPQFSASVRVESCTVSSCMEEVADVMNEQPPQTVKESV